MAENDFAAAERDFAEVLNANPASVEPRIIAEALRCRAGIATAKGDLLQAQIWAERALAIDRTSQCVSGLVDDYELLGSLYLASEKLELAEEALRNVLELKPKPDQLPVVCRARTNLSFILRKRGDLKGATKVMLESLRLAKTLNRAEIVATHYATLAAISLTRGQVKRARILVKAANAEQRKKTL